MTRLHPIPGLHKILSLPPWTENKICNIAKMMMKSSVDNESAEAVWQFLKNDNGPGDADDMEFGVSCHYHYWPIVSR